eukprot:1142394-Pelagomonas_calceolata.AAC.4
MFLRGRDTFSTWAAPKLKDLELLSMEVAAAGSVGRAGQGSWEHAWEGAGQTCSRDLLLDPTASTHSRGCCTKPGGQGQGAWVGRLSEPKEVFEDTTDEMMEGEGE